MTAFEKDQILCDFMGEKGVKLHLKYNMIEPMFRVIAKIQGLGYTFIMSSIYGEKMHYAAGFINTKEPFNTITIEKGATNWLDALTKLSLKFIKEYEQETID